ncbi:FMN-binding protein [Actinoplanes oblitus]|uniref:FMN-binding protein n=1 Tax=Actinoplanes oblitus TaxID=3040509 RepID=A0ABY8W9V1_9ACTN|nr:FMN-binding protein [Actinoplanes oblitus]WIM93732.1 FMN-binding protein [Actinoplanes oblitus]
MRRITLWLLSTVAVLVLLFSYRTSTNGAEPVAAVAPVSGGSDSSSSSGKNYTGSTVSTRWGDVQVEITVAGGKITQVTVPVYPTGNHKDQEINAYAIPTLVRETLDAQSADIDTVSGATVTSDGYLRSLQSALDAAHLG